MALVLVTGMSGTGKTTLLDELRRRGHLTVDTDYDGWTLPDGRWDEPQSASHRRVATPRLAQVRGCSTGHDWLFYAVSGRCLLAWGTRPCPGHVGGDQHRRRGQCCDLLADTGHGPPTAVQLTAHLVAAS